MKAPLSYFIREREKKKKALSYPLTSIFPIGKT